jgi:hypothetical protein
MQTDQDTIATELVEAYHRRKEAWPNSKFKPPRHTKYEHDRALPDVKFYRFRDNSLARLEGGDLIEV